MTLAEVDLMLMDLRGENAALRKALDLSVRDAVAAQLVGMGVSAEGVNAEVERRKDVYVKVAKEEGRRAMTTMTETRKALRALKPGGED